MPPELRRDRPADIRLYTGSTGTGKSYALAKDLEVFRGFRRARVRKVIWDWKDDHYNVATVSLGDLARRILYEPELRVRPDYEGNIDAQFSRFCRIAWAAQREDPSTDCCLVIEEAQKVTRPGMGAPGPWLNIVELGRVYGFSVFLASPRPAYIDLGTRSAATFVRCGRLGEANDARAMGERIGVPYGEIQRLPNRAAYVWDGFSTRLEGVKAQRT